MTVICIHTSGAKLGKFTQSTQGKFKRQPCLHFSTQCFKLL
jgi:hypothetical protein